MSQHDAGRFTTILLHDYLGTNKTTANGNYSIYFCAAQGTYYLRAESKNDWARAKNGGPVNLVEEKSWSFITSGSGGTINKNLSWGTSERINVVHHGTEIHDFFKESPFSYNGMDFRMEYLLTGDPNINGNADPNGTKISFGAWEDEAWAETSDIVYHEYTHQVVNDIYGGFIGDIITTLEADAMDEGLSDFFAAAKNNDSKHGDGFSSEHQRDLINNYSFDNQQGAHWNGQVIGGALWDIRQNINTTTAHELAFTALELTPNAFSFEDFGFNMVALDYSLNGGTNVSNIEDAFRS